MGKDSKIAWTHHTFSPWWGCCKVSSGCHFCYARELDNRYHMPENHWGPHAHRKFMSDSYWKQPLKWDRLAKACGEMHRVFCASMSDVMEVLPAGHPDAARMEKERQRLWQLIRDTPHLIWLLLTKRPENFHSHFPVAWDEGDVWAPNVWLGVTAENQEQANRRIPLLLETPAARRFVSCEPLLEEVTLATYMYPWSMEEHPSSLDWVIVGAESGSKARPMDEDWVRLLRDECFRNERPFFYKQRIENGLKIELPELDGYIWDEVPQVQS